MAECTLPAPCKGAGDDAGPIKPQDRFGFAPIWARVEISNWPWAIGLAAEAALDYAEAVHDFDCEDRGRLFPNAIFERCANPLLLMRYLPDDAIAPVRHEAERRLRAWGM